MRVDSLRRRVVCPACQTVNGDRAKFCNACGAPLALSCPACGTPHRPEQAFCEECGASLAASPARRLGDAEDRADAPVLAAGAPPVPSGAAPVAAAEMRLVSVLFVDLVGFTALSETRDAEDVRELLGRYFEQARTIVTRHGGTIEKFIGDAVMAVWGAPVAREDDAERAVRAALEIVGAVSVFGAEVGAPDLRARAGVVTGQVAALENPGEGLVVGDRVNTASRVQSAAHPGSVFVDEVTRSVTSAAIAYEDAGEHTVKGKAEPLRLWRALRVVAGAGGSARTEGLEVPFVGRDAELRLVKDTFHACAERGTPRLVAVSGEAGIGKSRLRQEFFQYIDGLADTVLWHSGRCLSYGEGIAYWALAEMARQRLGIPEDAPAEEAQSKLVAGLARWIPDEAERDFLLPRLGALLGLGEPGLGRPELLAGWRMFFERLAAHYPVALVFEDMQWADAGLLEFIDGLLDWSASSPIFVLTFARPELAERHGGWPAVRRGVTLLGLDPLDDDAIRTVLDSLVDGLPRDAARRITEQAQGIPLYAIETVRSLADRGALAEADDGRLHAVGELGELDVPVTLGSLLAARLDALTPPERTLVKAMSVFGGSFSRDTVVALGDVPAADVDAALASLVRKGVLGILADPLSPDRGGYVFAQGLLRTVAYETLSRQERRARHLAAAEHLETTFGADAEEIAEVLATHLLEAARAAGTDEDAPALRHRAIGALRRAAARLAAIGVPEAAERSLLRARELSEDEREQLELVQAAGEMASQSGRYEVALERLEHALNGYSAMGLEDEAGSVLVPLAQTFLRLGRNDEAVARASAGLDALGEDRYDPQVAELNALLGSGLLWGGHLDAAAPAIHRALHISQALELPRVLAYALNLKATLLGRLGSAEESRLLYQGAQRIAEEHNLGRERSIAVGNGGNQAMAWDRPEAEALSRDALDIARRRGDRFGEALNAGNILSVLILAGRWDEADALSRELLEDDEARPGATFLHFQLLRLGVLRGELDAARAHLAELSEWARSDDLDFSMNFASVRLWLLAGEGHAEEVLAAGLPLLEETLAAVGADGEPTRLVLPVLVDTALHGGASDALPAILGLLADRPPGLIPPYLRGELTRGRARIAAIEGRGDDAERELRRAIEIFDDLAYPYHRALAETELAAWLLDEGREEEADVALAEALPVLERLRAAPALARAQAISRRRSPSESPPAGDPARAIR